MTHPLFDEPEIPDQVKNETVTVLPGETRYTVDLTDDMVEMLAAGRCSEEVARLCWEMLRWKREHYRNEAREKATA